MMMKSKKRRSLQSLFIQPFTNSPTSSPLTSPTASRQRSSPTSPTPPSSSFTAPASAPLFGTFAPPPSMSALTGEKGNRKRSLSQSSTAGGLKMLSAAQAAVNAIVRVSHLGASEDASGIDTITSVDASLTSVANDASSTSASATLASNLPPTASTQTSPGATPSSHAMDSTVQPTRSTSPSSFLLDDDPFANLTPVTVGAKSRPSTSSAPSTSVGIIPASERPKPVHPELAASLAMPTLPPTPVPKSRLQDDILEEVDETSSIVDPEMMHRGRRRERSEGDDKPTKLKAFFAAKSAPTSPSRGYFSSGSSSECIPVPPLPSTPPSPPPKTSVSVPSSPRMPPRQPAPPPITRAFTNTRMQRPAHQRPAFTPRPSLPTLNTLATMNVVMTKKVRKGHVGAGLPFEPWDLPSDEETIVPPRRSPKARSPVADTRAPIDPSASTPTLAPSNPTQNERSSGDRFSEDLTSDAPPVSSISDRASTSTNSALLTEVSTPSSSSTEFSVSPPTPQPFLPSQIIALGSLAAEDVDITSTGRTLQSSNADLHATPPSKVIMASGMSISKTAAEVHNSLVAPMLPPLELHEEFSVPMPKVPTPEPFQAAEILAATRSRSRSPETDKDVILVQPDSRMAHPNLDKPLPPINAEPEHSEEEETSRWSLETDESANGERPSLSPTTTRSISSSHAGSSSDASSGVAHSIPHADTYGYGYGYDEWNPVVGSSSSAPLSRSLSTASSTSSVQDRAYDSGDGLQDSSSYPDLDYSTSRTSISTSFLHSPEPEWQSTSRPDSIPRVLFRADPLEDEFNICDFDSRLGFSPFRVKLGDPFENGVMTWGTDNEPFCIDTSNLASPSADRMLDHPISTSSSDQTSSETTETIPSALYSLPPLSTAPVTDDEVDSSRTETMGLGSRMREKVSRALGLGDYSGHSTPPPSSVRATGGAYIPTQPVYAFSSPCKPEFVHSLTGEEGLSQRRKPMAHAGYLSGRASGLSDEEDFTQYYTQTRTKVAAPPTKSAPVSRAVSRSALNHASSKPHRFPSSSYASASTSSEDESSDSSIYSDDDDVPLAKAIPGALTAQKSIRKKVKEERDAKRANRETRRRERQLTLRPAGAGSANGVAMAEMSSTQEAAKLASAVFMPRAPSMNQESHIGPTQPAPRQRQRTMTMPSKASAPPLPPPEFGLAFNPDALAKKLQNVKMMDESSSPPPMSPPAYQQQPLSRSRTQTRPSEANGRSSYEPQNLPNLPHSPPPLSHQHASSQPIGLRSARSFYRPSTSEHPAHESRTQSQHDRERSHVRQRSQSVSRGERRPLVYEEPVPPLPAGLSNQRVAGESPERERRVLRKPFDGRIGSTRTSAELEHERLKRPSVGYPPVPPISEHSDSNKQRVFIHSLQHYHMVAIGSTTSAGDLIAACEAEGVLDGWAGVGSWLVWEIAKDFGMERPVRDYELLSDVQASWLKDKTVNYFLLKKSSLASTLARSNIPASAPTHASYMEVEVKRGKWSKRWLRLKESGLYLSKRDNGRDETLLCHLSNFDVYFITRSQRAPKPFSFAVKSTDNLSFFENTDDYMHNFSCSESNGQMWIEKILLARSFVLHEERQVLFNPKVPTGHPGAGSSLSRSGTRKTTSGRQHLQPLVAVQPNGVFQPGSLLSGQ